MDESELEGTLVLEQLAQAGLVEEFFDAVDSDDFSLVRKLMMRAGCGAEMVNEVLQMMSGGERA